MLPSTYVYSFIVGIDVTKTIFKHHTAFLKGTLSSTNLFNPLVSMAPLGKINNSAENVTSNHYVAENYCVSSNNCTEKRGGVVTSNMERDYNNIFTYLTL